MNTIKKAVYSAYTKFAAVLLAIIFTAIATGTLTSGIADIVKKTDGELVYNFDSSFDETYYFSQVLEKPSIYLRNAYYESIITDEDSGSQNENTIESDVETKNNYQISNNESLDENIKKHMRMFDEVENSHIRYYISVNDKQYTNCDASGKQDFTNEKFYLISECRDGDIYDIYFSYNTSQNVFGYYSLLNDINKIAPNDSITICASIEDSYVSQCEQLWNEQEKYFKDLFFKEIGLVSAVLLMLIYLICTCGKNKDGEHKEMWLDNIFAEIHLFIAGFAAIFGIAIGIFIINEYISNPFPEYAFTSTAVFLSVIACILFITSLLSIVRSIKCKKITQRSIILKSASWICKTVKKILRVIIRNIKAFFKGISGIFSKKTSAVFSVMLLIYTTIIGVCGILTPGSPPAFFVALIIFFFVCFTISRRTKDIDEIRKGADEIRGGNLSYKIPDTASEDLQELADNINEIGQGLNESVAEKLKAERMKTELITNVSHDLKTPLTSIINYSKLLSDMHDLPQEAKDYVSIISKKGEKLKNLTQDLFEISKVQSGNEHIEKERLDVSLLINQAIGELDSEINESALPFCVNIEKDLYILADGKKMSRVVSNLISNILKYAMKNTRVFITAVTTNGKAVIEFKNISASPMDFDVSEITEKFVRGDKSRSVDGNGLGLAIAKGYTEACGGNFKIITDGDLFKVIIEFDIA